MRKVRNTIRLLKAILKIRKFNNIRSTYHKLAEGELENLLVGQMPFGDNLFPQNTRMKVQWYMAEYLFVCELFNELHGLTSDRQMKKSYLLSGPPIAISDLVVDDWKENREAISFLKDPIGETKHAWQRFYLTSYRAFESSLTPSSRNEVIKKFHQLIDSQIKSLRQLDSEITQSEADLICKEKCGNNFLFLRALIPHEITEKEKILWYEMGGFIQYCNDSQDLHKDLNNHLGTFATKRTDLDIIKIDLKAQLDLVCELIHISEFSPSHKKELKFLCHTIYTAITAKLQIFKSLCNDSWDQQLFKTIPKEKVRKETQWNLLLKRGYRDIINYSD